MKLISAEQVAKIHDDILSTEQGFNTHYEMDKINAIVGRIQNRIYYDSDIMIDPFLLSALYAESIAVGHPFPDGNKRTAFVVSITVLTLSLKTHLPDEYKEVIENFYDTQLVNYPTELMVAIASKKITYIELANNFKSITMNSIMEPSGGLLLPS